jgi:hypothetical protein
MSEEYYEDQEEITEVDDSELDDSDYEDIEEEEEVSGNPALSELYDVLPKSLHGLVEPVLNKWQGGIDQQFEMFAPYRKFAEGRVDPNIIEASMELARQISSNPKSVYDELAERYGWQQATAMVQDAVATAEAVYDDPDFDIFQEDEDPTSAELQAMKAELEALKQDRQEQISREVEIEYNYEIEESLDILSSEYGDFDQEAVVRRAMILADEYPDAELPQLLGAAFEQYSEEMDRMRSQVKRAPRVAGGTANSQPAPTAQKLSTREDRIAAIEAIAKQALRS